MQAQPVEAVDTLKIYDRLRHEGALDEKAARAVTGIFQEVLDSELVRKGELRSESDKTRLEIEQVRADLTREIEQVRLEIAQVRADLTREIEHVRFDIEQVRAEVEKLRAQVKADIESAKFETIKWVIGLILAQTGVLVTVMKVLR